MSDIVISVEDVWKQYRLGVVGSGTLGSDLKLGLSKLLGKSTDSDSIIQDNHVGTKAGSQMVWALQQLNFQVNQGEVLGVIGKNGAGKSTILKILSRVTAPTRGAVKIRGRIASLLEVGTGFHADLTGRENIFMNGAILGMRKAEIKSKLDEIIAFSGVEKYIDTPVKRYSSGMYVRLAFAVAAHLEPEILIIDEVLAVGDLEFQRKCLGKMQDVAGAGRTVIFVSHNMAAVRNLCTTGLVLKEGRCVHFGGIAESIDVYLKQVEMQSNESGQISWIGGDRPGGDEVRLNSVRLLDEIGNVANTFYTNAFIQVEVVYEVLVDIVGARMVMQLADDSGGIIFSSTNHNSDGERKVAGFYKTICVIPSNLLNKGKFNVLIHFGIPGVKVIVMAQRFLSFNTLLMGNQGSTFSEIWPGMVAPKLDWATERINSLDNV